MAEQLRNERDTRAGWQWWGARPFPQTHPQSPACLAHQVLSPMTQMMQRAWGQLTGQGEKSRVQRLICSLQGHGLGRLLAVEWLAQQSRLVPTPVPQCPSAPETGPGPVSPGRDSTPGQPHSSRHKEMPGPAASRGKRTSPRTQSNQDSIPGPKVQQDCSQSLWELNQPFKLPGRLHSP